MQQKRKAAVQDDPRWEAVLAHDARADGQFVYAVATTGVYCRPGCPSRRPRPEHISFFADSSGAEAAGFRACKRCKPANGTGAQQQAEIIARICRYIETRQEIPTLAALAAFAGWSSFYLQRTFRAAVGVTPRRYAVALRTDRMQAQLASGHSVTQALYAAGFGSSSRFYEAASMKLGMTPTAVRNGGRHMHIEFAVGSCSLGAVLVARSMRGLCAILLGDNPETLSRDLQQRFPAAELRSGGAGMEAAVASVVKLVEDPGSNLDLPYDIRGTAFQQRVWQALQTVPAGSTVTYTQLAEQLGDPKAVRAVAGACAANPLAVAIPCHRVVRSDGALAGYRWGVERKRTLLVREGSFKAVGSDELPLFHEG